MKDFSSISLNNKILKDMPQIVVHCKWTLIVHNYFTIFVIGVRLPFSLKFFMLWSKMFFIGRRVAPSVILEGLGYCDGNGHILCLMLSFFLFPTFGLSMKLKSLPFSLISSIYNISSTNSRTST